jgi:hypothetical protein
LQTTHGETHQVGVAQLLDPRHPLVKLSGLIRLKYVSSILPISAASPGVMPKKSMLSGEFFPPPVGRTKHARRAARAELFTL